MTRRKLVALVAAAVLLALGLVVFATGLFVTRTETGRGMVRDFIVPRIAGTVHRGSLHVGKVSGNFISGFSVDSIAIRDERNELFLSTGRVAVEWNWRDLIDNRVYVTKASVEHPYVHIVQHATGKWNFKEIFESPANGPDKPKDPKTRNLGDYVVFDSVSARDATFLLTMPWHPDDSLRGAARDSAIRAHLANPARNYVKTFDGYGRTYVWRNGRGLLSHVRLADPDSDKFGRVFRIATLSVDEYEPTFKFRNLRGEATHLGDSITFKIPRFDMPASTGRAGGKVWWGSDLPVRYAIDIRGDSVSLDDVNWVYPTLPRTGGGTLDLLIRNDPKNLSVVDFQLRKMDVRSTGSHLTGDMWFGTGAPLLLVRNVDVKADPVSFDLIRTLNGKPFPYDWRGDVYGTVKARGGPLTHFYVDDARGRFEDAHVRGAVSRFTGKGELDILYPAFTAFHGFNVNVESLDLRTIEFVNPAFPRLGGSVSGTATLDSSWLDVRFSNARIAHQDGPGEPSRATGSGRVTNGTFMIYDVTLDAQPLNATMLARSKPFTGLPVRGLFNGPIRARGTAPDLEIAATLQGAPGAFSFEGRADLDSIGGYGAHGHGQFSNIDLGALLERPTLPAGFVSGHYDVNVDSIAVTPSSIRGVAEVSVDRTVLDSVRVHPSRARVRFVDGRMIVDSLNLRTDAFTVTAASGGGIGLPQGRPDSLHFSIYVDSLGGLRPLVSHPDNIPGLPAKLDSLSGTAKVTGFARGTLDALQLGGELFGSRLYYNKDRGDSLYARFDLQNALTNPTGTIAARVDSVTLAGVALDTIGGLLRLVDSTHRQFTAGALSRNGPTAVGGGTWTDADGAHVIVVDSLALAIGDSRWRLAAPTRLTIDSNATRIDSLLLRNRDSAFVALVANVPRIGPAFAQLRAASVPLPDVGRIAQLADTLYGIGDLSILATGTKLHPEIQAEAALTAVKWSGLDVDRVSGKANYRDFRILADAGVVRSGKTAVTANASWPYDITLFGMKARNDSVRVSLQADTTDLAIVAPLFKPALDSVKGVLVGNVRISGTTAAKIYNGSLAVRDGQALARPAGVTFRSINGRVLGDVNAAGQDSINVQLSARTNNRDRVSLTGWVANLAQTKGQTRFSLKLSADSLHAFNRRSIADLYISTANALGRPDTLRLEGNLNAPVLTGAINVDRGAIFLADRDLARKLAVQTLVDNNNRTVTVGSSSMLTTLMTNLQIQGVPVTLGQEVKLRSTEADVRLTGELSLVKSTVPARVVASTGQFVPGLSLEGRLLTVGGTYNMNLGLVQREFNVLSGGTVTFDGVSSPETPLVDIRAQYNVKQFRDRPLGIIVNLKGRMPNPVIEFTSDAEYAIATSDLLSYLITGTPGFDFGASPAASQVLATFLSPTISAVAADRLRQSLGSFVDAFQFELGNYTGEQGNFFSSKSIQNYLYSATIGAEKRVYRDLYLNVNTGLCGFKTGNFTGVGAKIEYRFKPELSLQTAYDPPSIARTCNENQQALLSLVPTPSQISLVLRHTWRF